MIKDINAQFFYFSLTFQITCDKDKKNDEYKEKMVIICPRNAGFITDAWA